MASAPHNLLLDSLSRDTRARILALATPLPMPMRTVLGEADRVPRHAYFMTSGIASVVVELESGGVAEVALNAHEGFFGAFHLLGPAAPSSRCFIQVPGTALRVPLKEVQKLFDESPEFRNRVLQLIQQQSLTTSQLVACNRLHEAEQRLARWLLMVQDRVDKSTLDITQEFLSQMLGARRTTVATIAGQLQRRGLITIGRGKVEINDREGLIGRACECYDITRKLLTGLYK